ncbi:MAG: hypothetical protein KAX27_03015 [Candidatus Aminicenantes bacterium]|nr:hypothetical protein [Candidatus Aminicenantes bacterium]
MAEKNESPKKSVSIIEEIEDQLKDILTKKKQEVEKDLEEKIKQEKEEAKNKIDQIEKEVIEEKESLSNFRDMLAEFESSKADLKIKIKEHLDKAIKFQTDIETITGQTLEELKKVSEFNQQLEELQQNAGEKVSTLKKDLEEKFGIVAEVPESGELEEADFNLERELSKLKKIKELLETDEDIEPEASEPEPLEASEETQPEEEQREERESELPEQEAPQPVEEEQVESKESEEEPLSEEKRDKEEMKGDASFHDSFETLEKYRKGTCNEENGDVSYFEHNEKIILDGECLISAINNSFEEAQTLYAKLSQTESPKDQFFIKQEIIKYQETLRKLMLRSIRMCEKENCSLPKYTLEILNVDVLKNILEKVSMENWSNQDDFTSFDNYTKALKDAFYSRITPPASYLKSIIDELNIE